MDFLSSLSRRRALVARLGLALLSGVLCALAFPPFSLHGLIYVGFVPLLIAISGQRTRLVWGLATVTTTVQLCINWTWIDYMAQRFMGLPAWGAPIFVAASALVASQATALGWTAAHWLQKRTALPLILLASVSVVSSFALFPNIFFYQLAVASADWPISIQAIEFFGAWGLDVVIILCNVLCLRIAEGIKAGEADVALNGKLTIVAANVALLMVVAWFLGGGYLLNKWERRVASFGKKKIGIVQPRRPCLARASPAELDPEEFSTSAMLVEQGAELLVWPEGRTHHYHYNKRVRESFHAHVDALGVPLLFHDKGPRLDDKPRRGHRRKSYNVAHLLTPNEGHAGSYEKRKLVPFGEYYPFVRALSGPEKYQRFGIWPGEGPQRFDVAGMRLSPNICYELAFPEVVAEGIGDDGAGKVVVVQTNDGWYGPGPAGAQHDANAPLRAVESRVPVVHVLNDGASSVTAPSGERVFVGTHWAKGAWVVDMPYDANSGGTFHSRHPGWFRDLMVLLFTLLTVLAAVLSRRQHKP